MSIYNQEENKDNVVFRYIIVSFLADLSNKIYYYNKVKGTNVKVNVPFFSSLIGGERFLDDNFVYADGNKASGNYEVVPRGVCELNSINIDSSQLVNKFTQAELVKEVQGTLRRFLIQTNFLPITMSFDVTIIASNFLELLKINESIFSKLYKANKFSVDLGMFRVEAVMQLPEDFSKEKPTEFAVNDKKEYLLTVTIEVESFLPVFENGILLSEIEELIHESYSPNSTGFGVYRDGKFRFGNSLDTITINIDDVGNIDKPNMLKNTPEAGFVYRHPLNKKDN